MGSAHAKPMRYGGRDDGLSPAFGGVSPSYSSFLEEIIAVARPRMSIQTQEIQALYRRAFHEFGTIALWNMRPAHAPTAADALAITKALRRHGTIDGRRLAEQIEELCRADRK